MTILPRFSQGREAFRSNHSRTLALAAGLAGAAILSGCAGPSLKNGPSSASEAAVGSPLMGELTATSPANLNDGTRYSAHRLCGEADTGLTRYWFEAPFDARLSLFDDQGRLLALADQEGRGERGPVLIGPDAGECRLLVVNGQDRRAYGPYRLDVLPAPQAIGETLTLGRSVQGRMGADQAQANFAFHVDHPVELDLVLLDASRSLGLTIRGEGFLDQAQRCGESELRMTTYLQPGDYSLDLLAGERGAMPESAGECGQALVDDGRFFLLSTQTKQLPEGMRNGGPLNDGDDITGIRRERDNEYRLVIEQPAEVTLSLSSQDFDTILAVEGNGVQMENDDTEADTNSQLNTLLLPGEYRVLVQSYEDYGDEPGGEYRLTADIRPFEGELQNQGTVEPGTTVRGLQSGDINRYSLTVTETSEINIAVDSDSFDSFVELTGQGVSQSNDDGGGGYNALLQTVLEPGTYEIGVSSYSGNGLFTLSVEQQPLSGRMMNSGTLQVGDRVYGTMSDGQPLVYDLEVDNPGRVQVFARSGAVDTMLHVSGQGVALTDDDSGGNTDAMVDDYLEAGTYRVEVSSYDSYGSGVIVIEVTDLN
ncbi:PPC domain-containing protein [Saccharospirillum salsuginis]|uniref:Pre-peptidase C-terminal domain-containing protein n=1 Tax=Saccharospirillum salsuginis TaxID=418750 RepID=A0A918N9E5_9GAMM|nr:PPC domain-containing protein [Saccharospirillum salsuginis]GGX56106.1 hypothetical protein GCM10007392_24870 [Saccharospirillum salsuginis]